MAVFILASAVLSALAAEIFKVLDVDILTAALRQRLEDKSLGLEITDAAKQLIIDRGFDPVFGARPLKRYLQSTVETLIARAILAGDMPAGHVIKVDVRDGELVCE